ncbi:MAG: hypothetical protein KatS3mg089_0642 [Patescibacteria group bacterium]|nr:MAG: hypothetical protein KatS3mg089_0642 [Patescibacteria group bacterium]
MKNSAQLLMYYYRYKDSLWFSLGVIGVIFLVSAGLIIFIVFPQIQSWFSLQSEVNATRSRIAILKSNQSLLTSTSDNVLSKQFDIVKSALPYEKDFVGILEAINTATLKSGVVLNDFSFQVGDLSTKSAQLSPQTAISIQLSLIGELARIEEFLKEIYEKVPLAEVIKASYTKGGSSVSLIYFYKIAPEQIQLSYVQPIKSISGNHLLLLKTLEEWRASRQAIRPASSQSAELTPF